MPEVRLFIVVPVIMALSFENICLAGPPWRTDDPEPVELGHWEVYLASQGDIHSSEFIATAPHIEVNYGAIQDVQLHVIAPFAYSKPTDGSGRYGYADMEVGAKYRFIQETDSRPQVGTFPILVLPTDAFRENGQASEMQVFLPLWIQKSWGSWKTYGGGGYWLHSGSGNRNYWFAGWQVQNDVSDFLTCGVELNYQTASETDGHSTTGCSVGAVLNFNEHHHVLFAVGQDLTASPNHTFYVGYQLVIGS